MPDDVAVHVNDRPVRQNAADNIAVRIADKPVFSDRAQQFPVRAVHGASDHIRGGSNLSHRLSVQVNDGSVRQNPTDNVAVRVADVTVLINIAQQFSVGTVHGTPDHVRGRQDVNLADFVAVHIDNRPVRANPADHVAVRVADKPVFPDIAQQFSVRAVHGTSDHVRGRADLSDHVAARINDRSVGHDLSDDVAVRVADVAVGADIAQQLPVGTVNSLSDKGLNRRRIILRIHQSDAAQFLAVVAQCAAVRQQAPQNFLIFVDDRSVKMHGADVAVLVFTHFSDGNDAPQELAVIRQSPHRRRNVTDFLQIVGRYSARRQNGTDDAAVSGNNAASVGNDHADFFTRLVGHVARFGTHADGSSRSRFDNVLSADQTPDDLALHVHDVFPSRTDADKFVFLVNDGALGRKAADRASLIVQHLAVRDDVADRLTVKTDGLTLLNQAADALAVRIRYRTVKRRAPQRVALRIGNFAVGSHLTDDLARTVNHGTLRHNRTD